MYTKEEIIQTLIEKSYGAGHNEWGTLSCQMMRDIVSLLKEGTTEPHLMTLEEVIECVGKSKDIFIERKYSDGCIGVAAETTSEYRFSPDALFVPFYFSSWDKDYYNLDSDGKGWRCWTTRPSLEQIKNTEWRTD